MDSAQAETNKAIQEILTQELILNGVNLDKQPWLRSPYVIAEITHALIPEIHEGKINSYGVLFAENRTDLENVEFIPFLKNQSALARKLADGEQWFLFYEKDYFLGLVNFKSILTSETQLIRAFPISGGLLIQRSSTAITKFYQGDSLTIHDNRRWFTKPNVKTAAWKVSQCIVSIDKGILNRILEFAFHFMSPTRRVGAILIWFLKKPRPEYLENASGATDLESLQLSLLNDSHNKMICHLLSQVDGATFLDPQGKVIRTGVQLKYSEKSRTLIPEYKGTRHTSALRFSYDLDDAIVVAVSEDGPVTVFSGGANVADLQIYSAHKKARLLRNELPEPDRKIEGNSFTIPCETCAKQSKIEEVKIEGLNERRIFYCPVCKAKLYTSVCFSLEGRPYLQLK